MHERLYKEGTCQAWRHTQLEAAPITSYMKMG